MARILIRIKQLGCMQFIVQQDLPFPATICVETDTTDVKALTGSLSPGDQGLAQVADVEHGWCLDIIPVLLGEWIHTATENARVSTFRRGNDASIIL